MLNTRYLITLYMRIKKNIFSPTPYQKMDRIHSTISMFLACIFTIFMMITSTPDLDLYNFSFDDVSVWVTLLETLNPNSYRYYTCLTFTLSFSIVYALCALQTQSVTFTDNELKQINERILRYQTKRNIIMTIMSFFIFYFLIISCFNNFSFEYYFLPYSVILTMFSLSCDIYTLIIFQKYSNQNI